MSQQPEPLDYQTPPPAGRPRTGRNFGLGLLAGVAATSVAGTAAYGVGRLDVWLYLVAGLVVSKVAVSIVLAARRQAPGFGPGLLASLGAALLLYGGACFVAVARG